MFSISTLDTLVPSTFESLVQLVDAIFLQTRGKHGSMLARYPQLFERGNWCNIYCAMDTGCLVGSVVTRPFLYLLRGKICSAFMIGLVCVKPELQGKGIGRELVSFVTNRLIESECNAFLWTTIPEYYSTHGWQSNDIGVFGTLKSLTKRAKY